MSSAIVAPPPRELLDLLDALEGATGDLVCDLREPCPDFGLYESDVEAKVLFVVMLRHVESLLHCARTDLVLLPAAFTLARSALEQGAKILWLLHPRGIFEREARFLAHLSDEERMWERCNRYTASEVFLERSSAIREFREAVEKQLPNGTPRLARVPGVEAMLVEVGERKKYTAYILLSQYSHGSHAAGSVLRRGLGVSKEFGERASAADWVVPLEIAWWSLFSAAQAIERTCAGRGIRTLKQASIDDLDIRLATLKGKAP